MATMNHTNCNDPATRFKLKTENVMIDRKFKILAVNPVNKKIYTEGDSFLMCAKDKAVPAALNAYVEECSKLGCDVNHMQSVALLLERVEGYQKHVESKIPDTVGKEVDRCLGGLI